MDGEQTEPRATLLVYHMHVAGSMVLIRGSASLIQQL